MDWTARLLAAALFFGGFAILATAPCGGCKKAQPANAQTSAPLPPAVISNTSKKSDPLVKLHVGQLI